MNRAHLYRLELPAGPEPLVPRRRRLEITERVGPDGTVLTPLAPGEVEGLVAALRGARAWRRGGVPAPRLRQSGARAGARGSALAPHFRHVSVSSEINAEFREYERTCTTVLNAGVMPLADRYLDGLRAPRSGRPRAAPRCTCCTRRAA